MTGDLRDWHREDVAAAIRKTGVSLKHFGLMHGFSQAAVACALKRPWPNLERIIADHLRLHPQDIWPSRYGPNGEPLAGGWSHHKRRSGAKHAQSVNET